MKCNLDVETEINSYYLTRPKGTFNIVHHVKHLLKYCLVGD